MSNINGSIELPYEFEFTYEFSMLNFPCRYKKKLHKGLSGFCYRSDFYIMICEDLKIFIKRKLNLKVA